MSSRYWAVLIASLALAGCATEASRSLPVAQVATAATPYQGQRTPISIGKFDNKSSFMRGLFSDGVDRLGSQSKTLLITHLQQANRFQMLDRDNLGESQQEAKWSGRAQQTRGAAYVITGDVTEFGRKEVGDHQLFGLPRTRRCVLGSWSFPWGLEFGEQSVHEGGRLGELGFFVDKALLCRVGIAHFAVQQAQVGVESRWHGLGLGGRFLALFLQARDLGLGRFALEMPVHLRLEGVPAVQGGLGGHATAQNEEGAHGGGQARQAKEWVHV